MDAVSRMTAARARLILDKPFLGSLCLRLPLVEADPTHCRTTWSDGRELRFNRAYIESLDLSQTQFVLSREALQCALLHFYRRAGRDPVLWQTACDHAVHPILIDDGLTPPPDTRYLAEFRGMTAEEIYPLLQNNELQQSSRAGGGEGDSSAFPEAAEPSPDGMEVLAAEWRQRLAAAAQQAGQAGKLSANMARLVDFSLAPRLSWRSLLAQHLSATARNDYSYARPSSRRGDPAVFPGLRSEEVNLVVAVDTSGSIDASEIDRFFSEINAIKGQLRACITLLACDAEIAQGFPRRFEAWEEFRCETTLEGGGGTDFRPVFQWLDQQDMPADALLYFTDGRGHFPAQEPAIPTLWLIKGAGEVPFGRRIQLNE